MKSVAANSERGDTKVSKTTWGGEKPQLTELWTSGPSRWFSREEPESFPVFGQDHLAAPLQAGDEASPVRISADGFQQYMRGWAQ